MASTARQQPIEDKPIKGPTAANDNVEVNNASGSEGAKVISFKGNKIELNLDTATAANDNVEINNKPESVKKPDTLTTPAHEFEPEKNEAPNNAQAITAPKNAAQPPKPEQTPTKGPESSIKPEQDSPQTNPPNLQPQKNEGAQLNNKPTDQAQNIPLSADNSAETKDIDTKKTTQDNKNQNPPIKQQTPSDKKPTTEQVDPTPPPSADNQPPATDTPPTTANQPANEQPPLPQNTTTPPTINKEDLGQTGPHTTSTHTPNTIPSENQKDVANSMTQAKRSGGLEAAGLGSKIGEGVANKIKNGVSDIKGAAKNKIASIANDLQSDRTRKNKLKKERKRLGTELASLERTVDGMKTNRAMLLLRTISPSIYSQLTSLTFGKANAKDSVKIKFLQTNLVTLKTIKGILNTMVAFLDYIESLFNVIKSGAATLEIIIGFFIIALSAVITIPFFIFKFCSNTGKLSKAVTAILKDIIDPMIDKIEKIIEPLKKKVTLRKGIQNINVLLASTKADRKQDQKQKDQQKPEQPNAESPGSKNSPANG